MDYLIILQIIVSITLIVFILFQQRGSAIGSIMGGGGGGGESYLSRRGMEKKLFWATIIVAIAFLSLGILNLLF